MNKPKVLVVDDEWNMRNLVRIYLTKHGYEVKEAAGGREGLRLLEQASYDLVLLDVMMPDLDGWQVCEELRRNSVVPVIMLTARTDTRDKVQGLGIGADDYITKPFEPEELIARVQALLRRTAITASLTEGAEGNQDGGSLTQLGAPGLSILTEARLVKVMGGTVDLTPKEYDLLVTLASAPQRVFSREMLVELIWGLDYGGDSRVVDTHIKNMRDKLQKAGLSLSPIQTVWGVGYRFSAGDSQ